MDLCDALKKALGSVELESLEDVFRRYSIRELALMWLGLDRIPRGAENRRQYLSARRLFERYRAGRGLGPRGGKEVRAPRDLDDFLDSLRARIPRGRPRPGQDVKVTIEGRVTVSRDRRRRTIAGLDLVSSCVDRILELLDEDLCDEAEETFSECIGDANDFGATPTWEDVSRLVIT